MIGISDLTLLISDSIISTCKKITISFSSPCFDCVAYLSYLFGDDLSSSVFSEVGSKSVENLFCLGIQMTSITFQKATTIGLQTPILQKNYKKRPYCCRCRFLFDDRYYFSSKSVFHVSKLFPYYESIKRKLNKRLTVECRCDGRLKVKDEGSTRLTYTG